MLELLAEYDVAQHNSAALFKVIAGVLVLVVSVVVGIVKGSSSDEVVKEYSRLSAKQLEKRRGDLPKNVKGWLNVYVLLGLYVIGRHVYGGYRNPDEWAGHIEMILTHALFYLAPAAFAFVMVRDLHAASSRRLRVFKYVAGTSAFLMFAWGAIVMLADNTLWGSALSIAALGLFPTLLAISLSEAMNLRRYDAWVRLNTSPAPEAYDDEAYSASDRDD